MAFAHRKRTAAVISRKLPSVDQHGPRLKTDTTHDVTGGKSGAELDARLLQRMFPSTEQLISEDYVPA